MKRSLLLLILMGQFSLSVCYLHEYYFIDKNKTWYEAQKLCREMYTDLATVYDMDDMMRLTTMRQVAAWIGLYKGTGNRTWHWALPWVQYSENTSQWKENEPNDIVYPENCAVITGKKLADYSCTKKHRFICFNGNKQQGQKFNITNTEMTWQQAQNYCREHHTDLISGYNQLNDVTRTIQQLPEPFWSGLFRDTWWWSDGYNFSFRNWDPDSFIDNEGDNKCAMTMLNKGGKWASDGCNNSKPFFCYDDKIILIKQSKTWEDALNYCRENYNDLVSITSHAEQVWARERAKNASTRYVWMGLHYTCTLGFWFWVSDEVVSYENWASDEGKDDCYMSGVMETQGRYKWSKKADNEKFEFICSKF